MRLDPNTPEWVQHLALRVEDMDTLHRCKTRLAEAGVEVLGPVDHTICQSIYFFDPSGHRLELTVATSSPELDRRLASEAPGLLEEWTRTKRAPERDGLHAHLDDS